MYTAVLLTLAAAAVERVNAWGNLGHETVAYIAQNFVQESTASWAQDILDDSSTSYLANYATWADTYKYTSAGEFSKPFHFIDAQDNPPSSCNVDYDRDCGNSGCSVSAIANYTQRVQSTSLSSTQVNYALRFLIHFIGDITQPLHDEAYEYGGNDIDVTFNGDKTELHATWDTDMPEQLVGGYEESDAKTWAANLTAMINGQWSSQKSSWIAGLNINDPVSSSMAWATDANKYVCSVVMPHGASVLETGDLYPTYYNSVIGTIELQIAKAGYRLAKWLDAIADNVSNDKRSVFRRGAERARMPEADLTGREFMPAWRPLSLHQLRREVIGFGCGHKH